MTGDGRGGPVGAVCFDMDGVLVDSESYWVPFENEEILPRTVPGADVTADDVTGMPYREIYDYLDERHDVAISREAFVALFDEAAEEIFGERAALLPVLADLLPALDERGVDVALVTSSPHHWIDVVLERFDLGGAFDVLVSADDLAAPGKPEPHVYRRAADLLGVDPADCLAVEDSANGMRAAHGAGMTVVGFRFGADPGDGPADHVADSPAALERLVLELVDGRRGD